MTRIDHAALGVSKPPMLDHAENITDVLHQNARRVRHIVQVAFAKVRQAGAGHQVEVFEGGVEAFAQAGVEGWQWGVAVDQ